MKDKKTKRKAIFVRPEVFVRFRAAAKKDGRKYGDYLMHILDKVGG